MAPHAEVFRYTSLPAEIRNTIMEYALVPGDVYPCPKEPKPTSTNPSRKLLRAVFKRPSATFKTKVGDIDHQVATTKQPGPHLLTTCKKAYQDGHYMFYTMNTFHLPAGSAHDAEIWLNHLKPDDRSMIKRAGVTFSLADLTPEVLVEMEKKWLWDLPAMTRRYEQRMVFEVTYILCWRFWQDKIRFLQQWDTLDQICLKKAGGEASVFEGEAFRAWDAKEEKDFLDAARGLVKAELEGLVGQMGWKATRKLLMAGGVNFGG